MKSFALFFKKRPGKICGKFLTGPSELREKTLLQSQKVKCFLLFFLAFRDEHKRQFVRERQTAVNRNHKKSFLGPGSNLAALRLIPSLQPECQQESHTISFSAKWAIHCATGVGGLSVKSPWWTGKQTGSWCL